MAVAANILIPAVGRPLGPRFPHDPPPSLFALSVFLAPLPKGSWISLAARRGMRLPAHGRRRWSAGRKSTWRRGGEGNGGREGMVALVAVGRLGRYAARCSGNGQVCVCRGRLLV